MRLVAIVAVALLVAGCCREGNQAETAREGAAGRAPAPPALLPPFVEGISEKPWSCRTIIQEDVNTIRERVCWKSGDLQIIGQVCRPRREGRFPVVVYGHAQLLGLGAEWQGGPCQAIAADGNVVLMPSFRGQDGSEGKVEGCAGEVDDALAMLDMGLAQPYADGQRTAWAGISHGGCVALKALARGTQSRAAVALFPAVDWTAIYTHWDAKSREPGPPALAQLYKTGSTELVKAFGGPPSTHAAEYQRRSVLAADLEKNPTPLFLVHGTSDAIIPAATTCKLAAGLTGTTAFRLTPKGDPATEIAPGCDDAKLTPQTAGSALIPKTARLVGLYEGGQHDITSLEGQRMARDGYAFIKARLAPSATPPK